MTMVGGKYCEMCGVFLAYGMLHWCPREKWNEGTVVSFKTYDPDEHGPLQIDDGSREIVEVTVKHGRPLAAYMDDPMIEQRVYPVVWMDAGGQWWTFDGKNPVRARRSMEQWPHEIPRDGGR